MTDSTTASAVSIATRRITLQNAITTYVAQGFTVISQTDTTAQLEKAPGYSKTVFLLLLILVAIIGGVLYWLWATKMRKTERVYLQVDEDGVLRTTKQ